MKKGHMLILNILKDAIKHSILKKTNQSTKIIYNFFFKEVWSLELNQPIRKYDIKVI